MEVIVVCGGTLGEVFDMLRKAFINMGERVEQFNDLIKEVCMYDEEPKYKEHISFSFKPVKIMKSQVMDRKPKCIRARTVC
ncbi:hypothetical protein [Bacillus cereus group sp. N15]|uniref:hypothetical protein n=1 Tax=Bacillus cereus group sp. N15 TaxID=2794588 RepID=UPI0018F4AE4E|nr:hypothetical protein [Bacillus cereus group sp. N15]MBJ8063410.1 hypothetical protein [Bacillus cereus group sp. N15]